SSGAYGAWINTVLHELVWPASKFDVLADAGNGVITQSFLDNYFPNWNFAANIPTDIPGLTDVLTNGTGIVGYTEVVANFFPRTRWAQYSAAYDGGFGGQTSFYNILLNDNDPIAAVTWWNASCAFNTQVVAQALATPGAVLDNRVASGRDLAVDSTRAGAGRRGRPSRRARGGPGARCPPPSIRDARSRGRPGRTRRRRARPTGAGPPLTRRARWERR